MPWPHPPDYNEAIQTPRLCCADAELQQGEPALNALGLPWPRSGNSADVYKIICPNDQTWAVKCFTREVRGLRERYLAVSEYLARRRLPFMVEVHYLEQGIRVHGHWYPIVKMRWVDGLQLNELAREYADKPLILERLAQMWVRLAQEMRNYKIVHGDLQHGNVLLVPEDKQGHVRLRLVDYDGVTVPALEKIPSGEVGHPNYQHPQRLREGGGGAEADRFAHLVIYTAIRALAVGGSALWERFDNGENLLFREQDFQKPAESALFKALLESTDADVRALTGYLLIASQGPLRYVSLLQELVTGAGRVVPLTDGQQQRVARILAGEGTTGKETMTALASDRVIEEEGEDDEEEEVLAPTGNTETAAWNLVGALAQLRERIQARTRWSDQTLWAVGAAAGTVATVLFIGLGLWLTSLSANRATAGRRDSPDPPIVVVPAPTQPASTILRPRLAPPRDVAVKAGQKSEVRVRFERRGHEGALAIHVAGLPEGLRHDYVVPVDDLGIVLLQLSADANVAAGVQQVEVWATVGGMATERTPVTLTISRTYAPRLVAFPDVALRPGEERTIKVAVEEFDPQEPVELKLGSLPAGVRWKVTQVLSEPDRYLISVTFTAVRDAEPSVTTAEAVAQVGAQSSNKRSFAVTVQPAQFRVVMDKQGGEKAAFSSGDGVTLVGMWYAGTRGPDSPCALLIHDGRASCRAPGWDGLARALQEKGFAVLAFDFRGHGDSTAVHSDFWSDPTNKILVRSRARDTIGYRDFEARYWPVLINDIAAARMFLDQKNDLKECNASRVFVVGVQEGAALAALWLFAEWSRFELVPGALPRSAEGRTITGAAWLSAGATLAGRPTKVLDCLTAVAGERKVPMAFIHGGDDAGSTEFSQKVMLALRPSKVNLRLTGERVLPGTRAAGHELLRAEPAVERIIVQQAVLFDEQSTAAWAPRASDKKAYVWQIPRLATPVKAKSESDKFLGQVPLVQMGLTQ